MILIVLAVSLFFVYLGILFWWQYSMCKDYDKRFGHLFKENKDLKGNN